MNTLKNVLSQARLGLSRQRPSPEQDAAVLLQLQRQWRRQQALPLLRPAALGPALLDEGPQTPRGLLVLGVILTLAALALALNLARPDTAPQPAGDFWRLVSEEQWQQLARDDEPVWVVPADIPRERLALMGLPYDTSRAADTVRADLMMHRNGQVLAVRFLQ
ncbi:hypothetical protein [Inhella gelatinilytica]|uniref:Uncharacterized protein n=1 Tax=Inhella gelatinilytica TaxID=2795030 RepID=A0A931NEW4_9BURK|nr:hypothetical protein [Inhella gelatinilytica]MBH9553640.1 hypothetical protein [Inhella gelatinilytica]